MKYIVLSLLIIGCTQSSNYSTNETQKLNEKVDSLLTKSQRNIDSATVQLTKTDSVVVEKVEKTVEKIQTLETENKQLKTENNALKTKLNTANSPGESFELLPVSGN